MPNFLFRNHDGKYFVDVTAATGTGHLQKGHGVASRISTTTVRSTFENMGGFVPEMLTIARCSRIPGTRTGSAKSSVKMNRIKTGENTVVTTEHQISGGVDRRLVRRLTVRAAHRAGQGPYGEDAGGLVAREQYPADTP